MITPDQANMIETMLRLRGRDHEHIQDLELGVITLKLRVLKWKAITALVAIVAVIGWAIALSVVIW